MTLLLALLALLVAHVSRRIEAWEIANDDLSAWSRTQIRDASLLLLCLALALVAISIGIMS